MVALYIPVTKRYMVLIEAVIREKDRDMCRRKKQLEIEESLRALTINDAEEDTTRRRVFGDSLAHAECLVEWNAE